MKVPTLPVTIQAKSMNAPEQERQLLVSASWWKDNYKGKLDFNGDRCRLTTSVSSGLRGNSPWIFRRVGPREPLRTSGGPVISFLFVEITGWRLCFHILPWGKPQTQEFELKPYLKDCRKSDNDVIKGKRQLFIRSVNVAHVLQQTQRRHEHKYKSENINPPFFHSCFIIMFHSR